MESNNKLVLILAAGALFLLLAGLYINHAYAPHKNDSLNTSMDVDAIHDATASQTIDTVTMPGQEMLPVVTKSDQEDAQKRKQVMALVDEGLAFVKNNPFDKAMSAFTHGRDFIRGELYLFVYDVQGVQFASGLDERFIWKNWYNQHDTFGAYMVREMIKKAKEGGGWVTYQWRNATKVSYVKPFTKDRHEYLIGAGYYPHSKRDIVIGLVKAAVAYFNDVVVKQGFLVDEVFSTLSYPAGRFVTGDLYLYAVDFNGQMMANGNRPGLIGTNVLNVKDSEGKLLNQEIINKLKNSAEGIWIEYRSRNAIKETYAEKIVDKEGRQYFVACGYYPTATPEKAVDLVKNGYEFMKTHGLSAAVSEFSDKQTDNFRYGDLYLTVWNMKGMIIANGANVDTIGTNQYDVKDEDGKYFVREIIEKANKGGGWVDIKLRNAFQSIYVEKVELGSDNFVIGCGLYPISKREMALLMARSAASYLRSHTQEEAFNEFSNTDGKFIRGDLYVFAVAYDGICKVWGDTYELIWRNIMSATDDAGKPYIQVFINTVKQGASQVTYKVNGHDRVALLEPVEKDGENFVIGTAYNI